MTTALRRHDGSCRAGTDRRHRGQHCGERERTDVDPGARQNERGRPGEEAARDDRERGPIELVEPGEQRPHHGRARAHSASTAPNTTLSGVSRSTGASTTAAAVALDAAAVTGYATIDALLRVVDRLPFWVVCLSLGALVLAGSTLTV